MLKEHPKVGVGVLEDFVLWFKNEGAGVELTLQSQLLRVAAQEGMLVLSSAVWKHRSLNLALCVCCT